MITAEAPVRAAVPVETVGREDWPHAVESLAAEATEWSHAQGWRTAVHSKEVVDETTQQTVIMPVLDIITEQNYSGLSREVKLVLEPVTFRSATGTGPVDLYIWPAMYRVRLLQDAFGDIWRVKTDSGIYWPLPWNEDTFTQIAKGLLNT